MRVTFKKFDRDFRDYYGIKGYYTIRTEEDMQEVIYELYDSDNFEVDYENKRYCPFPMV